MSWKIKDFTVDPDTSELLVDVDFDVSGVKKADAIIKYPADHGLSQENFYNQVVEDLNVANPEAVKDKATKDAEKAAKKAAEKTESDSFAAANDSDPNFKLKNLKDTDV